MTQPTLDLRNTRTLARWMRNLPLHHGGWSVFALALPIVFIDWFCAGGHLLPWPEALATELGWVAIDGKAGAADRPIAVGDAADRAYRRWRHDDGAGLLDDSLGDARLTYNGLALQRWAQANPGRWTDLLRGFTAVDAGVSVVNDNLMLLRTLLGWTADEAEIVTMTVLLAQHPTFQRWEGRTHNLVSPAPGRYAAMMGHDGSEAVEAILQAGSRLRSSGLIGVNDHNGTLRPMDEWWLRWLSAPYRDVREALGRLVQLMHDGASGVAAVGDVAPTDAAIILALLQRPVAADAGGTNILLHGARRLDKLGWAYEQARAAGRTAWVMQRGIPASAMAAAVFLAQRWLRRRRGAMLVVPEAEQALQVRGDGELQSLFFALRFESDESIASEDDNPSDDLLTRNPVPTLWCARDPSRIVPRQRGKFLYSAEVKPASRARRRGNIQDALRSVEVSQAVVDDLTKNVEISREQLDSAARLARHMAGAEDGAATWVPDGVERGSTAHRDAMVTRAISQSQRLFERTGREALRTPTTTYSLDLLNTTCGFTIEQILAALRRMHEGTLCFYGPPGTGKTLLAEHIAITLDQPLLVRRASDLKNKYVGESEKNIRAMFDEAESREAILLLDEADTFLTDRRFLTHEHDLSVANELLQGMEAYRGVFICATNRFDRLDSAVMRRFTFKVGFAALDAVQRRQMFVTEALRGVADDLLPSWRTRLEDMDGLTPGDFANVKRQIQLLGVRLDGGRWIEALDQELAAKRSHPG